MPKQTKRFIDKKKAVSFHLVNRSQQDPLVADDTAPQHVLVPVIKHNESKADRDKRIEEQQKYGIYFDDEHNYLQSLKDVEDNTMEWPLHVEKDLEERQKAKIQLPSSVFASKIEEEVGMLAKAAPVSGPQLHLDPDVVAAMDEDFDYEDPNNELEDNFIELANGVSSDQEFDDEIDRDEDAFNERDEDFYVSSDDAMDDANSMGGSLYSFGEEETKSRITRYSLSSAVLPRNENLQFVDRYFEKKFAEYDDEKIGVQGLEESDTEETPIADARRKQLADEYFEALEQEGRTHLDKDKEVVEKTKDLYQNMDDDAEFIKVLEERKVEKPTTTCPYFKSDRGMCKQGPRKRGSIMNAPTMIDLPTKRQIRVSLRTGIPIDEVPSKKSTSKSLESVDCKDDTGTVNTTTSVLSQLSTRSKNETPEQRTERKHLLKQYRKERRIEKKMRKLTAKEDRLNAIQKQINDRKSRLL